MTPRKQSGTESILKHWREAVPDDRLAHLVKDATRALLRALQMRLTAHDVSLGHWTFLRILWEKEGLTQRELSEEAGVMEPTTFSALNAMEKLGYITRRHLPDNRKNVYVFLTPKGRQLKDKLVPLAEDVNRIAVDRRTTRAHRGHAADAAGDYRKSRAQMMQRPPTRSAVFPRRANWHHGSPPAVSAISSGPAEAEPPHRILALTAAARTRSCPPCCAAPQDGGRRRHPPTRSERQSRRWL